MKSVKQFQEASPAIDFVPKKDKETEIIGKPGAKQDYQYRSDDEQKFADKQADLTKTNGIDVGYPHHPDNEKIFTGEYNKKPAKEGETKPLKSIKDFMSQTPSMGEPRKEPKGFGADAAVKEEVETLIEVKYKANETIKFKKGGSVRLDKTQAEQLNDLMKELDNKNKKEMDKTMRLSKQDFERTVEFAQMHGRG
jgi:hypothetical protein